MALFLILHKVRIKFLFDRRTNIQIFFCRQKNILRIVFLPVLGLFGLFYVLFYIDFSVHTPVFFKNSMSQHVYISFRFC